MPSRRATACAVVRLSPVSMTMRMPSALQRVERVRRRRLHRIGDGDDAGELAVDARRRSRSRRRARSRSASRRKRRGVDAELRQEVGIAERDAPALDRAERALAGRRVEVRSTGASAMPRASAARDDRVRQRMLARALDARGEPQHFGLVEARGRRRSAVTAGLPSVSVPVLSTTSVSTFSMRSSASAFLISTPACAPRPTPTMIDIGVARPSAHGQAMISTATAATSP